MKRRDLLAACGALAGAASAGCLADGAGSGPASESPPDDSTATPTATSPGTADRRSASPSPAGSPSPTGSPPASPTYEHAADQPDPDHQVRLSNEDDEPHTVAVTVTGPEGTTVYDGTHDLDPGSEAVPYNLKQADPDGIQAFDVAAEMGDRRETVTIRTNACYGDALVYATAAGELTVTYSIC